jgi:aminoglycoside phosphotransferase
MSMTKTQVYLTEDDLGALHELSERTGKSVAELIREAIRTVWLRPSPGDLGPVSIWSGPIRRTSSEHDSIYDEP